MASKSNIMPLKVLVISMGILLIAGTVLLFVAIIFKASKEAATLHCDSEATVTLPSRGTIASVTPQGSTVQITYTVESKTEILTVDRCSGKITQTLTIETSGEPSVTKGEKRQ